MSVRTGQNSWRADAAVPRQLHRRGSVTKSMCPPTTAPLCASACGSGVQRARMARSTAPKRCTCCARRKATSSSARRPTARRRRAMSGSIGRSANRSADFVGKRSLARPDMLAPDRKQLVGLLTDVIRASCRTKARRLPKAPRRPLARRRWGMSPPLTHRRRWGDRLCWRWLPAAARGMAPPCTCSCRRRRGGEDRCRRCSMIRRERGCMAELARRGALEGVQAIAHGGVSVTVASADGCALLCAATWARHSALSCRRCLVGPRRMACAPPCGSGRMNGFFWCRPMWQSMKRRRSWSMSLIVRLACASKARLLRRC